MFLLLIPVLFFIIPKVVVSRIGIIIDNNNICSEIIIILEGLEDIIFWRYCIHLAMYSFSNIVNKVAFFYEF